MAERFYVIPSFELDAQAEGRQVEYRVMDTLEYYECVGKANTFADALTIAKERYEDTGGECELTIQYRTKAGTWDYLTTPEFDDFDE